MKSEISEIGGFGASVFFGHDSSPIRDDPTGPGEPGFRGFGYLADCVTCRLGGLF